MDPYAFQTLNSLEQVQGNLSLIRSVFCPLFIFHIIIYGLNLWHLRFFLVISMSLPSLMDLPYYCYLPGLIALLVSGYVSSSNTFFFFKAVRTFFSTANFRFHLSPCLASLQAHCQRQMSRGLEISSEVIFNFWSSGILPQKLLLYICSVLVWSFFFLESSRSVACLKRHG